MVKDYYKSLFKYLDNKNLILFIIVENYAIHILCSDFIGNLKFNDNFYYIFLILAVLFWNYIKSLFIVPTINMLDVLINSLVLTFFIRSVLFLSLNYLAIFAVLLLFCFIRSSFYHLPSRDINTVNISDVYDGNLNSLPNIYYISDEISKRDLLNRNTVTSTLYNAIVSSASMEKSHVIGIDGEWGFGKTTIIKSAIKKLDESYITFEFDPWIYENEEAMIASLYKMIIDKLNFKCIDVDLNKVLKNIKPIIKTTSVPGNKMFDLVFDTHDQDKMINFNNEIGNILRVKNKNIVIIIDNLDRASKQNVTTLIKLLPYLFNIDRTTIVLAYEKERLNKILTNTTEISEKYIDKIIFQEIKIPHLGLFRKRLIFRKCINNVLQHQKVYLREEDITVLLNYLDRKIDDIRTFIKYLNFLIIQINMNKLNLNFVDYIFIKTINYFDLDLYEFIRTKPSLVVKKASDNFYGFSEEGKDKDNQELKIKLINKDELILLQYIFCLEEIKELGLNEYSFSNRKIGSKEKIISNTDYFDLYFSADFNEEYLLDINVEDIINYLLSEKTQVDDEIEGLLKKMSIEQQIYVALKLKEQIVDNTEMYNLNIVRKLKDISLIFTNEATFFAISPRERIFSTVAKCLEKTGIEETEEFLIKECCDPKNLGIALAIIYWIKDSTIKNNLITLTYDNVEKLLNEDADFFSHDNFTRYIVFVLYNYEKTRRNGKVHKYIMSHLNAENAYRVGTIFINKSTGIKGYGYHIGKETLDLLEININDIKKNMDKRLPSNNLEETVYKTYEHYIEKKSMDEFDPDDYAYYLDNDIDLSYI